MRRLAILFAIIATLSAAERGIFSGIFGRVVVGVARTPERVRRVVRRVVRRYGGTWDWNRRVLPSPAGMGRRSLAYLTTNRRNASAA